MIRERRKAGSAMAQCLAVGLWWGSQELDSRPIHVEFLISKEALFDPYKRHSTNRPQPFFNCYQRYIIVATDYVV
jgi:hypothetical protein